MRQDSGQDKISGQDGNYQDWKDWDVQGLRYPEERETRQDWNGRKVQGLDYPGNKTVEQLHGECVPGQDQELVGLFGDLCQPNRVLV